MPAILSAIHVMLSAVCRDQRGQGKISRHKNGRYSLLCRYFGYIPDTHRIGRKIAFSSLCIVDPLVFSYWLWVFLFIYFLSVSLDPGFWQVHRKRNAQEIEEFIDLGCSSRQALSDSFLSFGTTSLSPACGLGFLHDGLISCTYQSRDTFCGSLPLHHLGDTISFFSFLPTATVFKSLRGGRLRCFSSFDNTRFLHSHDLAERARRSFA